MDRRAFLGLAGTLAATSALAQGAWPDRTIRCVVPFAPGGNTDLVGRLTAQWLGTALGVSVVVENRGGAGGILGTDAVAKAAPDGNTLLVGSIGSITVAPALEQLPYDPLRDLAPISLINTNALVLIVRAGLPIATVPELLAALRARPDGMTYGSSGIGGLMHISALLFAERAGVTLVHVPYRSGAQAAPALISGDIELMFANLSDGLPLIESGHARALAVTTATRDPQLPQVPALAELGFPGFAVESWNALFAPAGTPAPIVDRLAAQIAAMVRDPEVRRRMAGFGSTAVATTPAEFAARLRSETTSWAQVLRSTGLARNG